MRSLLGFLTIALCGPTTALAVPISWTDWTSSVPGVSVSGTLVADGTTVDVTYSGPFSFAQTDGTGTNYWVPDTYSSNPVVDNPPPDSDILAFHIAGTKTISFSQAIRNPLIAMVSWNNQVVDFGTAIEIIDNGPGFWGGANPGEPILNVSGTGFSSGGEFHGVIRLPGTFTSITFTDTNFEDWHGITIGVEGLAVPGPGALALLGIGLIGVGIVRKAR